MDHKVKKRGRMNQPSEGYYVDCVCGRMGGLWPTREEASAEHRKHKAEEAAKKS